MPVTIVISSSPLCTMTKWVVEVVVPVGVGSTRDIAPVQSAFTSYEPPTLARRGYRFMAPVNSRAQPVVAHDAKPNLKQPIVRRLVLAIAVVVLSASTIWYLVSGRVESSVRPESCP